MSFDFHSKYTRPAASAPINPGPYACQLDALATTLPYPFTLQCDTIFRAYNLCSLIPMIIWCDDCLLVALWFRFHIELANCLLFGAMSSDLISKCERQKPLRTRRERSGAPHASLVYHLVVAWVVWKNFCAYVWHFFMTVMSSFCCYRFVCIVLKAWPEIWPVGIYNCSVGYGGACSPP